MKHLFHSICPHHKEDIKVRHNLFKILNDELNCFLYIYIKLLGFNIKDNGIRYYNFDIVPYFELSILLLRESHIATQI